MSIPPSFAPTACALAVSLLVSANTLAQTTAPANTGTPPEGDTVRTLDTVVVTGERVDRSLRETASSVSVIGAEDIEQRPAMGSVQDAIGFVPNVIFPDTVSAPIIRGQDTQGPNFGASAFLGGTVPRATINMDGRYLGYYELVFGGASIWDLESIEVFRGPQTVSQGANSIAGAVVVRTKDPTFHREAAAQVMVGSDQLRRASVAWSGPLVDQELAVRMAVDYSARDTFINYVNPAFASAAVDPDFSSLDARLKLLWKPQALPGLQAKLTLSHVQGNRPTSEAASTPYADYQSRSASMPNYKQWSNSAIADVSYDFGSGLKLSNRTDFSHLNVRREILPVTNGGAEISQSTVSNETRLTFGDTKSAWSGVVGLFLNRTKSDEILYIRGVSDFDDKKTNVGLFGEVSHRFAERWLLTGGLRYQRDRIQRTGATPYARAPLDFQGTFSAVLPKLSLAYDINSDVTVGGLVSKGYNPGGVGVSFAQAKAVTFKEESVWNYELFSRASLLGGRLQLTGNLFFNDFKNSQRLLPDFLNGVLYGAVVHNADKARSYGLEVSADFQATHSLRLRGAAGLLKTRISRFSAANGDVLEGREFGRSPGYMLNLGVDWAFAPAWTAGFDVRHTDGYHSTDENVPAYRIASYTVANARLSYKPSRHWELFAHVNNLFDKRTATWKYDDRSVGGIAASVIPPRQIGIGAKVAF